MNPNINITVHLSHRVFSESCLFGLPLLPLQFSIAFADVLLVLYGLELEGLPVMV